MIDIIHSYIALSAGPSIRIHVQRASTLDLPRREYGNWEGALESYPGRHDPSKSRWRELVLSFKVEALHIPRAAA